MRFIHLLILALLITSANTSFSFSKKVDTRKPTRASITDSQTKNLEQLRSIAGSDFELSWQPDVGVPAFISGNLRQIRSEGIEGVRHFLSDYAELFRLNNPADELVLQKTETDELGMTHYRFQQVWQTLTVANRQLIVHVNKNGMIESISGGTVPSPGISIVPNLDASAAVNIATTKLQKEFPNDKLVAKSKLMVLVDGQSNYLVWEVRVTSNTNLIVGEILYIDAQTGNIVRRGKTVVSDGPAVGDGIGVLGGSRVLHTYQVGTQYHLQDASRIMYQAPIDSEHGVIETYDAHNTNGTNIQMSIDPNSDNHWNDNISLRANVDAQYQLGRTYEFYRSAFNRNSYDNNGASLVNLVHYSVGYDNAFWSQNIHAMIYGDGGTLFRPLPAAYDVIVHELTHGVTFATSNLEYLRQSGAINESMSDIMAAVADSGNWTIAEDVTIQPPYYLRSLQDPSSGNTPQPNTMFEYNVMPDTVDQGGVHTNSGIPNHAFYYAATMLNHMQAGSIWYRANTVYLTSTSQFTDLRNVCVRSARDLYGGASAAVRAINRAFDAVELVSTWGNSQRGYFEGFETNAPAWSVYNGGTNTSGVTWDTTQSAAVSGTASVYCSYGAQSETQDEWLYSEPFQLPAGSSQLVLRFSTAFNYATDANDNHYVKVGTNLNDRTGFSTVLTLTPANIQQIGTSWVDYTVPLTTLTTGTNYYLAFEYRGVYADVWYMDDVELDVPTSVSPEAVTALPNKAKLYDLYPNPFNSTGVAKYYLLNSGKVKISLYNTLGEEVAVIANGMQTSGMHEARVGQGLTSGVYFIRMVADHSIQTKKIALVK